MRIAAPSSGSPPDHYDDIAAALAETSHGRAFLAEHARRARRDDSDALRAALARIETRLDRLGAPPPPEAVPLIARLEALVWTLRESGVDDFICSKIEGVVRDLASGVARPPAPSPPLADRSGASGGAAPPPETATARDTAAPVAPLASMFTPITAPAPAGADDAGEAPFQNAQPVDALDPRLAPLIWLDHLPPLDRLALFA